MSDLIPVDLPRTPREGASVAAAYRTREADILARTLWGEARGEGTAGMQAVAAVVLNRVALAEARGGMWWGVDVISVCLKPWQFSCWNRADPNYRSLSAVGLEDPYFRNAILIARAALAGRLRDPTGGATHYHATGVRPDWAKGVTPTATIGRHVFYSLT
ncbi:MAG TPA: cell wall hydrolase [Alphaproteobacteria bacterium]|nr:cell wall hydrolase [Alphaproteobacteria bacterium]